MLLALLVFLTVCAEVVPRVIRSSLLPRQRLTLADPGGINNPPPGWLGWAKKKTNFFLILLFYSRNQKWMEKLRLYTSKCRCGGETHWVDKIGLQSCNLLQVFQVKIFRQFDCLDKVARYINRPDLQSFYK